MKVLHVLAPARFGGLERVVQALASGQKRRGHDVRAVVLLERGVDEPPIVAELKEAGLAIIRIVEPARAFRAQRRSIAAICREMMPEVMHTHGYLPDVLAASLGRNLYAARVSTVHGFTGGAWRNRFYEWLQRLSYRRFDAVVAVSQKLAQDLGGSRLFPIAISVLPNAWSPVEAQLPRQLAREALKLSNDVFNIGWVGRVSHEKGPDILVDALPLLDESFHATVIGDGVERRTLERRARELQIEDRISWRGEIGRAGRLYPAFDLFVNSSRTEGTPITLFEAMQAGVPVVATAVGGVPDVLSAEEGILIPPEDPVALAAAIRQVRDCPADSAQRASRARARLEKDFAATPWLESYDRIYRGVIRDRLDP